MKSIKQTLKEGVKNVEIGKDQGDIYNSIHAGCISYPGNLPIGNEVEEVTFRDFYTLWEFSPQEILSMIENGGRFWYIRKTFNAPFQPMSFSFENPFIDRSDDLSAFPIIPEELLQPIRDYIKNLKP